MEKRNICFTAGIRTPYCPLRGLATIPTNGLVGRSEGMRLLGKPRSRWEGKISCNIQGVYLNGRGPKGAYWVRVVQDKVKCGAFVNMVKNILWGIFDWMSDYQLLRRSLTVGGAIDFYSIYVIFQYISIPTHTRS
jgi:hypothetical protein